MPEKFIWRVGIALHCLPRILLFPPVIHKHYKNTQLGRRYNLTTWWFGPLNFLSCISQVVENGALMTLTYVSSTDNFGKIFCESCFIVMVGIMDCQSIPLINTHSWKLDWCSILILINTWSTLHWHLLDQQSVDSQRSVNWLICNNWKLVQCRPTVYQDVDGVSIKCQVRIWWILD